MIQTKYLFTFSLITILGVYFFVFGEEKTMNMIKEEYLFFLALIPLFCTLAFFKIKLKDYQIIDFNKNSTPTLKSTIMFFLVFQVIDYIYEDGFKGMISQWILYWVMGLIAVLILENINYYKNFKILKQQSN